MTWLPDGYSFTPQAEDLPDVLSVPAPGYEEYGGSTRTTAVDGAGKRYRACNAWGPTGPVRFMFRIFEEQPDGSYRERQYWGTNGRVPCRGRGSINVQGEYIAVVDESGIDDLGPIPGWVPRAGNYVVAEGGVVRLHVGALVGATVKELDLSRFGSNAVAYNLRLTISADRGGARTRVDNGGGLEDAFTLATQAPGIRTYAQGLVNAPPDQRLVLFSDNGGVSECFVDLLGLLVS